MQALVHSCNWPAEQFASAIAGLYRALPAGGKLRIAQCSPRVIEPRPAWPPRRALLSWVHRHGRIVRIAPIIDAPDATVFDATDPVVAPGLIDLHVHLREPGFPDKETIATDAGAAGDPIAVCEISAMRMLLAF